MGELLFCFSVKIIIKIKIYDIFNFLVAKIITDGRYGTGSFDLYMSLPYCYQVSSNISDCYIYPDVYSQCGNYECQHNRVGLKCYGMI